VVPGAALAHLSPILFPFLQFHFLLGNELTRILVLGLQLKLQSGYLSF
jgi:hypothetical protein